MNDGTSGHRTAWEKTARQAFLMVGEGMPLRSALARLENSGARGPGGRPLSVATLWRHLTDPAYAGLTRSRRTFRLSEPIVSEELFAAVQAKLRSNRRNGGMKQK